MTQGSPAWAWMETVPLLWSSTDRASLTMPVQRGSTILNSDVRTEAVSVSQVGGPKPKGKLGVTVRAQPRILDLSPHDSPLGLGPLPTLVGPLP